MRLRCARFGRRRSLIAYYAVSGVALILSQVIPEQTGNFDELPGLYTTCTLGLKRLSLETVSIHFLNVSVSSL